MRPLTSGGHRKWLNGVERKRDHIAPGISSYNGSQLLLMLIFARSYIQPSTAFSIKSIESIRLLQARRIRGIDLLMLEGYLDS